MSEQQQTRSEIPIGAADVRGDERRRLARARRAEVAFLRSLQRTRSEAGRISEARDESASRRDGYADDRDARAVVEDLIHGGRPGHEGREQAAAMRRTAANDRVGAASDGRAAALDR